MRFGVRLLTVATATVATGVLLVGCSSSPAEELEDWWSSGGDDSVKALSDSSSQVNTASMQVMDDKRTACQELLAAVAKAKKYGTPPSEKAKGFWAEALTDFEQGSKACVAGVDQKDEPQTNEGIREVQRAIGILASAVSMIRSDLEAK
ncbi:hypothetical protein [Streptomyces sp. NBC_01264]|uniref:hypothetical protein n=1 Tax=Streptomyces sp. NBC_01264 TaxID=2903804 RepID=UPI0022533E24|nr:hypothetical protein [Streptomyces sp. NBC_01264]MCX4784342.1 hypothetical protein [Streptomyces sp. NBC_01264]